MQVVRELLDRLHVRLDERLLLAGTAAQVAAAQHHGGVAEGGRVACGDLDRHRPAVDAQQARGRHARAHREHVLVRRRIDEARQRLVDELRSAGESEQRRGRRVDVQQSSVLVDQYRVGAALREAAMALIALAQLRGLLVPLDRHAREAGREADQVPLARRRLARLAVVHRQRAEHLAVVVVDRHGPAGAQAVGHRERAEAVPQRRALDVLDDDHVIAEGRRTAAAHVLGDQHGAEAEAVSGGQVRCGAERQHVAVGIEQQHRAEHAGRPGFHVAHQRIEHRG
ncbi:MAG: hypothetical protein U1F11_01795 [Steroidobacteraceae bacterium]